MDGRKARQEGRQAELDWVRGEGEDVDALQHHEELDARVQGVAVPIT